MLCCELEDLDVWMKDKVANRQDQEGKTWKELICCSTSAELEEDGVTKRCSGVIDGQQ